MLENYFNAILFGGGEGGIQNPYHLIFKINVEGKQE